MKHELVDLYNKSFESEEGYNRLIKALNDKSIQVNKEDILNLFNVLITGISDQENEVRTLKYLIIKGLEK